MGFLFGRRKGTPDPKKGLGGRLLKEFRGYANEKRYDEALRCGSEYIRKIGDHNHDLLFTMGAICFVQKRYAKSLGYLDKALEIGSYDTEALLLKARAHMMLGQSSQAARSCRKIQEVDPENGDAKTILADLGKA